VERDGRDEQELGDTIVDFARDLHAGSVAETAAH
jgi:hypothetical protein